MQRKPPEDFTLDQEIANLEQYVREAPALLRELSAGEIAIKPEPEVWSKKEMLGHLADAAVNHHQCFVRVQHDDLLSFPDYPHHAWVQVQDYQGLPWEHIVGLWAHLNRHLTWLLRGIPDEKWQAMCLIGHQKPVPFEKVVRQYVKHVRHFLRRLEIYDRLSNDRIVE